MIDEIVVVELLEISEQGHSLEHKAVSSTLPFNILLSALKNRQKETGHTYALADDSFQDFVTREKYYAKLN